MDSPEPVGPSAEVASESLNPERWIERYGDDLYRYALSRLRSPEAAEEVVQETFVAAWKHVEQYSGTGSERGWLMGILRRKVIDFVRQRNRTTSLDDSEAGDPLDEMFDQRGNWRPEWRSNESRPLDSLERVEFWRILEACLRGLPTRQADAFVLRELEEQSTEEICKALKVSSSNVWVLLHRARTRLSRCMNVRWHQQER